MSKYFSNRYESLTPYTPGEQPQERKYVKLNTNESPFPPSLKVIEAARTEAGRLNLYSDPESKLLTKAVADRYGLKPQNVIMTNGSDEALNFAFMAFSDEARPIVFPDITYGFYPVFAQINHIPFETIPLKSDYSIDYKNYVGINKNIVIANPNAPTGILMPLFEIEEIVKSNPNNIIIIDEAYIDFCDSVMSVDEKTDLKGKVWPESAINLLSKYDNLIVTGTYSKSRSLAGARLGFAFASEELINDLNTIKYSTNPYNVNRLTSACGIAAIEDDYYYMKNCQQIIRNREFLSSELIKRGFVVLPSSSNFVFAKIGYMKGIDVYKEFKKEGILVRHFETERLKPFNRITIGTKEEIDILLETFEKIKNKD